MKLKKFNKIDSFIFDLDGTLWDASKSCTKAWNEALKQLGNNDSNIDEATIRSFSGLKIDTIFKKHFDFIPDKDYKELFELYQINERSIMSAYGGELFPHVKEVLTELSRKYKLFIVSNCLTGYIENFIEFHKFQNIFTDFESSGNSGLAKNENIQLIIDRNNLQNPIYVGDTLWDHEAAQKANVTFIYAKYGFGQVDNPDWEINEFIELEQLIKE